MASTKLWKTVTNLIVEKVLTIGQNGRLVQKNTNGTFVAFNLGAEVLTAARTVLPEESGETYYLALAAGFVVTLPLPTLGMGYTFIVRTPPTGASYTIVTAGSANIIRGMAFNTEAAGLGSSGTTADTISFVLNSSLAGDRVDVRSDGTNWFVLGSSRLAASLTITTAS